MDRNTIFGIVFICLIIIGFSIFNRPSKDQLEQAKHRNDSIALVESQRQKVVEQEQIQNVSNEQTVSAGTTDTAQLHDTYGVFASSTSGANEFISIENDLLKLKISTLSGRVYSAELKNYKTHDGKPLILFDGDSTIFSLNFFVQNRQISTQELYFEPQLTTSKQLDATSQAVTLPMRAYAGSPDKYIEYVYTVTPGTYMVDFNVRLVGLDSVIAKNINQLDLYWEMYLPQQEKGRQNEATYCSIFFKHLQDEVDNLGFNSKKDIVDQEVSTSIKWIAFKDQFFSSVLIADSSFSGSFLRMAKEADESKYIQHYRAEIEIPYERESDASVNMNFYFGPNHYQTLKKYENLELQELVNLGVWFIIKWINKYCIIPVFNFIDNFISNYGIIILILTIVIKIVLMPLTYGSYMSMAKMRVLKPQIDEINEKIPKDKPMERQQATMALYKKVGVSPMGGCLPQLLQLPILLAMYRFFPTSIELRQESFLWAKDLSTYDSIWDMPFTIPFYGDHISLFTILMTVTTIITMKMSDTSASTNQMPGMKTMMYIMPITFLFFLNSFSAGLTYYYFLVNVITFGQNALFKLFVDDEAILKKLHANSKKIKPKKKSGFQERMEKMAKQRGYKLPK